MNLTHVVRRRCAARKMAVKMHDPGYTNAGFYENTEGGAAALRTTRNRRS